VVRVNDSRRSDPSLADHYVAIGAGSEGLFLNVTCVRTLDARDIDSSANIRRYILDNLRSDKRLPGCESPQEYQLLISYEAGNGVCIDCDGKHSSRRSAFAILAVVDANGKELASAEWQDWRGGSDYQVADRFIVDLRHLVNGDLKSEVQKLHEH
jgi:hypothetical protein